MRRAALVLIPMVLISGVGSVEARQATTTTTTTETPRQPAPQVNQTDVTTSTSSAPVPPPPLPSPTPSPAAVAGSPEDLEGDTGDVLAGKQMFLAGKLGVVVPFDLTGYDTTLTWGGEIGFRSSRYSTVGINVLTSERKDLGSAGRDVTITPIMLKFARYPALHNGAWFGIQVGLVNIEGLVRPNDTSDREFGAGFAFGYDYRIDSTLSTGIDVNHVTSFGDDVFHLVNFVVPIKIHF